MLVDATRSFFGWCLIAIVTPFWMITCFVVWVFSHSLATRIFMRWYEFWAKIFGVEFQVENKSEMSHPQPGFIYAQLNQTSLVDTLVVPHALWNLSLVRPFANIEYLLIPFYGWMFWLLGAICVVRQIHSLAVKSSELGIRLLNENKSIGIAVEGKRSQTGELLPFKKGTAVMAIRTQRPIIPAVILGAREVWPYGSWIVKPGKVILRILPPVETAGLNYADRDNLTEKLRKIAEANVNSTKGD